MLLLWFLNKMSNKCQTVSFRGKQHIWYDIMLVKHTPPRWPPPTQFIVKDLFQASDEIVPWDLELFTHVLSPKNWFLRHPEIDSESAVDDRISSGSCASYWQCRYHWHAVLICTWSYDAATWRQSTAKTLCSQCSFLSAAFLCLLLYIGDKMSYF